MRGLIQRVSEAQVRVAGEAVGRIGPGVLLFLAVQPGDGEAQSRRLLDRVLGYRIFADADGRMNRSLAEVGGGLLVVSQFTLAADTRRGMRPGFSTAADPETAERLYEHFLGRARAVHGEVASGRYGAAMQVALVNDGPVTLLLEVPADRECG